jgi:hypothetical protein
MNLQLFSFVVAPVVYLRCVYVINCCAVFRASRKTRTKTRSRLFEIADMPVRFDHVARFIVNANDGIMRADEKLTAFLELEAAIRGAHSETPSSKSNVRCWNGEWLAAMCLSG